MKTLSKRNLFLYSLCLMSFIFSLGMTSCGNTDELLDDFDPSTGGSLSAPTGGSATVVTDGVLLSWNSVNAAEFYVVLRASSVNGSTVSLGYIGENGRVYDTYTVDTNPLEGDNYYFIQACNRFDEKSYSAGPKSAPIYAYYSGNNSGGGNNNPGGGNNNPGGGSDNPGGGTSTQKPSAPTGLRAYWDGPASYPYVVLSWNSVSNATSYTVYRSTSANGSYSKIGNSSYSSYSDNNVSIGKTYYYKVTASNSTGTSNYSNYVSVTLEDQRKPGPVTYGNCTATSTSITLRWTIPTDPSYGKPNKIVLRLYDPTYKIWVDAQELSGTATSVTFSFGMWIDSDGYVRCGVIPYNDYGSGGGSAKVYDTKGKKWIN